MATQAEIDALDRLLATQEKAIRDAFRRYVNSFTTSEMIQEITRLIERGEIAAALTIVDSHIRQLSSVFPQVFTNVGVATAAEISAVIPTLMAVSFDPAWPTAANVIQRNTFEFVSRFTQEQRNVTRTAMTRAYQEGLGTAATARAFRNAIGLNAPQEQAVANYRRLLNERSREALNRANRPRRNDAMLERAIERDKPLTPAQIDRMVERYRFNTLNQRAETIARTEGVGTMSIARREALEQSLRQTNMGRERVRREWHHIHDKRVRDWHANMQLGLVGMDEPYIDGLGNKLMYPGDRDAPPETIINCRCVETFAFI